MEKQTFHYATSGGKSGVSTLRLKPLKTSQPGAILAQQLEHLTSGAGSELVVEGKSGARITAARVLKCGGLMAAEFRYAIIYEGVRPQCYAVFYVSASGEVMWIAGPKSVSFERAWSEFRDALQ